MLKVVSERHGYRMTRIQDVRGRERGGRCRGVLTVVAVPTDRVEARGSERFDVEGDEPTAVMAVASDYRPFGGLDS